MALCGLTRGCVRPGRRLRAGVRLRRNGAATGLPGTLAGCREADPRPARMTGMRVALGTVAHAHRLMRERVCRPPWTADRLRADSPLAAAARPPVRRVRAAGRARRAADMAPVPPALGLGRIPCVAEPEHAEADRVAGCRSRGEDACGMRPRASRLTCARHG